MVVILQCVREGTELITPPLQDLNAPHAMLTITDFKSLSKLTKDNRKAAAEAWGRGWGLGTFQHERWAFKEYTFRQPFTKEFIYRSGQVLERHGSFPRVDYIINGEQVSRTKFLKEFAVALSGDYETKVA